MARPISQYAAMPIRFDAARRKKTREKATAAVDIADTNHASIVWTAGNLRFN